jgi:DEAD/DEAH box helicase domain-containing protein
VQDVTTDSFSSARLAPRHDLKPSITATLGAGTGPSPADLLGRLRARGDADPITHVERVPARAGTSAPWPTCAP